MSLWRVLVKLYPECGGGIDMVAKVIELLKMKAGGTRSLERSSLQRYQGLFITFMLSEEWNTLLNSIF